jgi:nucleotide-binding universal stress UspA family protein
MVQLTPARLRTGADEEKPDLLLVWWQGAPRQNRWIASVIRHVPCSTLVVKGETPVLPGKLLVCSGGRPIAQPVVEAGAWLGSVAKADVTLLHVAGIIPSMYTGLDRMEEGLDDFMQRDTPESNHLRESARYFKERGVNAVLELRHGETIAEIMRSTQLAGYDLIVIGASDAVSVSHHLVLGNIMKGVLDVAPCPVLIARPHLVEAV